MSWSKKEETESQHIRKINEHKINSITLKSYIILTE